MHIKMTHEALAKAAKSVAGSLSKDKLSPWRFVRIEADGHHATFTACDGDIQIERRVAAEVAEPGVVLVTGKQFVPFANALPGGVGEIRTKGASKVEIEFEASKYTMGASGVEDWPSFVGPGEKESTVFLPAVTLREMLRKTSWAMSKDDTRKTLKSVHAELANGKLTMVATDGRCLGKCEFDIDVAAKANVSFPEKLVGVLMSLLGDEGDARLAFDNRAIRVTCNDWSVTSRAIDEIYPNWRQVVPSQQPSTITVDRADFIDEVARAALSAPESGCISVAFAGENIGFSSVCDLSRYQSKIKSVSHGGEDGTFDMDFRLFRNALGCLDADDVTINYTPGKPAPLVVTSENLPWLAVVMPMRRD